MKLDAVLYVNLDESTYRRECVEAEIAKVGLTNIAQRWPGVRVNCADSDLPHGFTPAVLGSCFGPNQCRGALGCAMAHWNAYHLIKNHGWQKTLILEDDAVIDAEHFKKLVDKAPDEADIVYLNRSKWPVKVIDDRSADPHFEQVKGQLCTVGYIVSQSAISRLIERCDPYYIHPDPTRMSVIDVVLANEMGDMTIFRPKVGAIGQNLCKFGSVIAGVPAEEYQRVKALGAQVD